MRLSCLDDDAQGEPLEVLWEQEVDAEVLSAASWGRLAERGFDPPRLFSAYLHTLRWNSVTSTDRDLFQAPYRAGIDVMAYQLEPLRKALRLPRVNLFIADDVGLGKTIEAGLILRELLLRQKVRRVVVACPPSVVLQWRDELESRFGLTFVVLDRDYVLEKRRERGYGVNPWATHSRFVISHALLRDEHYAAPLRSWLQGDAEPGLPRGTLLILDEAHNAAPASGARYAVDSRLTRVLRDLAPLFEHRLFLSATPHNGHSNSFSALLEILDPQRFCRGVPVVDRHLEPLMVRRLKGDLREVGAGFPLRRVVQLDIDGLDDDDPDLLLPALLDRYREAREARFQDASRSARNAVALMMTALQKRLLSSTEAFASTLRVHRKTLSSPRKPSRRDLRAPRLDAPGPDDDRADLPDETLRAQEDAEVEAASEVVADHDLAPAELALLDRMSAVAEHARHLPDARVRRLLAWLRDHCLDPSGAWNERRVLIFTEFTDTRRYLDLHLREALAHTDRADARIASFHGGMDEETREDIKRAFNAPPARHPLRILLATDAAREGVNLQNHCADLFHFDVPWNPSRMEQRNGRIDRKLQRSPEVRCHYFFFTQRPEDRVLKVLIEKTQTIQGELGSLSQVLEGRLSQMLEGGLRRPLLDQLRGRIEAEALPAEHRDAVAQELDGPTRERRAKLEKQLEKLRDLMAKARTALGFDEALFRDALSCSLGLLGARGLEPVRVGGGPGEPAVDAWTLPLDDERIRKDPTWTETLDTLRPPRPRDLKPWEWRKTAPIRPVVFRDTGSLDDRLVHLHLEHRLAQRLLGRFLAQGFVHDDLSRGAAVLSPDPIPRVLLLGRLSLHGDRAARLHDEILPLAARWSDPASRKGPLVPYGEATTEKTLALVEGALLQGKEAPELVQKRLRASVDRDIDELRPHADALAAGRRDEATGLLAERGEQEARDLRAILDTQLLRIRQRLAELSGQQASSQLALDFPESELRQLEADQRHWRRRIGDLEAELELEPARVRASYAVRAHRFEIIGVVYLWPETG